MTLHVTDEDDIIRAATSRGFWLMHRPLDTGGSAWTWLFPHDDTPKPLFLTRRQAVEYMGEQLGRS
jgi:hypothetical protein